MAICVKCGKEGDFCLCEECMAETDIEKLCRDIAVFNPGQEENKLWIEISNGMSDSINFRSIAFALSEYIPSPRKEYIKVLSIVGNSSNIAKAGRPWFYGIYESVIDSDDLTVSEKNRLHGIALGAYFGDYEYEKAEGVASILIKENDIPRQAANNLADYYINTRRYEVADKVIEKALQDYSDDPVAVSNMEKKKETSVQQKKKAEEGKQVYMPNPRDNKNEAKQKYKDFMASIGIEVKTAAEKQRENVIPKEKYPEPVETREADFDTFVAFDLETTGVDAKIDAIIEIGAIKVVNGEITETAEYIFQELVKPLKRKVPDEITKLTGITHEEASKARTIQEVFPDFMKFAGDSILLGYNCMAFDSRFLVRAGRYSNLIIDNKYFDVLRYVEKFKEELGLDSKKPSLEDVSDALDIENPQAHRALADAVTTAKIFMKLKEMDNGEKKETINDILADIDDW